ncbi:MAG: tRNA (guanosine(37)-N1)-methyltransferase TrmD [Halothiobacillaceae bacterium]
MQIEVISLFPELVASVGAHGMPRVAVDRGGLALTTRNPRDFTHDRHRTVDDRPYGGGPGMLMKVEPLVASIRAAQAALPEAPVIYLSPQGAPMDQKVVESLARLPALILLCGRYEGIDERVIESCVDRELSIGDYVLSGGELGAMVVVDAVARLLPGVLGHEDSAREDSFSDGLLDCPHYTRPEVFEGRRVPEVLLSGDHAKIARWRRQQALGRTWLRRPDLIDPDTLDAEDRAALDAFLAATGSTEE